jgi:hypothetical protein
MLLCCALSVLKVGVSKSCCGLTLATIMRTDRANLDTGGQGGPCVGGPRDMAT